MRRVVLMPLLMVGCRFMAPAQNTWTPARPYTSGSGVTTNQGDAPIEANRCGIDCTTGFHCDEQSARCVADAVPRADRRDAGAPWLP
ncbi:MAG: hypothetical protein Q8S33_33610 [Myxococcales bacterium]|nr:hypothetical protein [Myxococcales bacterium]MDP3505325.1 hypothetical protein [Myxococcales bacterium]